MKTQEGHLGGLFWRVGIDYTVNALTARRDASKEALAHDFERLYRGLGFGHVHAPTTMMNRLVATVMRAARVMSLVMFRLLYLGRLACRLN